MRYSMHYTCFSSPSRAFLLPAHFPRRARIYLIDICLNLLAFYPLLRLNKIELLTDWGAARNVARLLWTLARCVGLLVADPGDGPFVVFA